MSLAESTAFKHGPGRVRDAMRGFPAPWWIAGGWAIDLALDRETRPHQDVEIAIFRRNQGLLHSHFRGWTFQFVNSGQMFGWEPGQWLALPIHEIHGRNANRRSGSELEVIEVLLNEEDEGTWRFRRDPAITLPLERWGRKTPSGIPALAPEVVLLYKAKAARQRDEQDFAAALPALDERARDWLREALRTAHPGHDWIEKL